MHHDQISVSVEQVAALLVDQLPTLAGQEIVPIDGAGTVNAIFRIGDSVTARFPLRHGDPEAAADRLRLEASAAAEFLLASPVAAAEPLGIGRPGHGYPMPWATQSWIPGFVASPTSHEASAVTALDVADTGRTTLERLISAFACPPPVRQVAGDVVAGQTGTSMVIMRTKDEITCMRVDGTRVPLGR